MSEELSAYHESGHALTACLLGAQIQSVSIDPDRDDGPDRYADIEIAWPRGQFTDRQIQQHSIDVALSGPAAEMIYRGEPYHPGFVAEWAADWRIAWNAANWLADERARLAFLETRTVAIYQQFQRDDVWAAIAALADHLLAHERMDGDEVTEIVRFWCG